MDFDALALSAANVMVSSMLTDGWAVLKARVVKMFKGPEERDEQHLPSDLEASRIAVANAGTGSAEAIKASAVRQWQVRIRQELEDDPELATRWAALVEELKAEIESDTSMSQGSQYATGDRGAKIVQIGRDSYGGLP